MSEKVRAIGIDIGGTNTVVGLVTQSGTCLQEMSFPTRSYKDASSFVAHLADVVGQQISSFPESGDLIGIGIAAPNVNFLSGTIEAPANLEWGAIDLMGMLKRHTDLPMRIINDANAAALGELHFGVAKGVQNFLMITLGTGLGSGIVIDGKILNGAHGLAGELGHSSTDMGVRKCGCGKVGCLETFVSAPGLRRTAIELMARKRWDSDLCRASFENITSQMIAEAAAGGDALALEAFEFTGKILGRKLADFVTYQDPEAIILFGGLVKAGEILFEPIRRYFEASVLPTYRGKVAILESQVPGGRVAVLGAASLFLTSNNSHD